MDLNNIRITEEGMAELDGDSIRCSVPRDMIRSVSLRSGVQAERPIRQLAMGLGLSAIGFFPIAKVAAGSPGWTWSIREWGMAAFLIPGVAAIVGSFRKGSYLHVETEGAKRKLPFRPEPTAGQLEHFLGEAQSLGFDIVRAER